MVWGGGWPPVVVVVSFCSSGGVAVSSSAGRLLTCVGEAVGAAGDAACNSLPASSTTFTFSGFVS